MAVKDFIWNWGINWYAHELVDVEVKRFLFIFSFYKTAKCRSPQTVPAVEMPSWLACSSHSSFLCPQNQVVLSIQFSFSVSLAKQLLRAALQGRVQPHSLPLFLSKAPQPSTGMGPEELQGEAGPQAWGMPSMGHPGRGHTTPWDPPPLVKLISPQLRSPFTLGGPALVTGTWDTLRKEELNNNITKTPYMISASLCLTDRWMRISFIVFIF